MIDQAVEYIKNSPCTAARDAIMDYAAAKLLNLPTGKLYPAFMRALKTLNMSPDFWTEYEAHIDAGSIDQFEDMLAIGVFESMGGVK